LPVWAGVSDFALELNKKEAMDSCVPGRFDALFKELRCLDTTELVADLSELD